MAVIKISVKIPKASDHEKIVERGLKHRVIDKVIASFFSSTGTIECTYDVWAAIEKCSAWQSKSAAEELVIVSFFFFFSSPCSVLVFTPLGF